MAFADAIFDGWATLDGLTAVCVRTPAELRHALNIGDAVPVAVTSFSDAIEATSWAALNDARMRKREVPEGQRGLAPITIGLGPNFVAGETVDLAIETMWGDRLGEVIAAGATLPLGGDGRARFVYAPEAGRSITGARIGDRVEKSAIVATVRSLVLRAPIGGVLRGLTRSGVEVAAGTKVIEVDPRGDPAGAFGLGERPGASPKGC
jgi:xanthine dehydrogenase accessory factor